MCETVRSLKINVKKIKSNFDFNFFRWGSSTRGTSPKGSKELFFTSKFHRLIGRRLQPQSPRFKGRQTISTFRYRLVHNKIRKTQNEQLNMFVKI